MTRRRQVRLGYPQAFIQLTLQLAARHGRRQAAKTMALPLSTVYRWFEQARRTSGRVPGTDPCDARWFEQRVADCEAHGFDLRQRFGLTPPRVVVSVADAVNDGLSTGTRHASRPRVAAHGRISRRLSTVAASLSPAVRARVQRARAEIDRHYYAHLSCERLAGIAGMSRFHFIRTFKSAFATAPYHYLMQVRIRHARELLSTTAQPLDTVASAVGFDSQSSLCKAFRSVEGVSLSSYFHGMRLGSQMPRLDSHT
jgi:AraC-like DNA-binding protein